MRGGLIFPNRVIKEGEKRFGDLNFGQNFRIAGKGPESPVYTKVGDILAEKDEHAYLTDEDLIVIIV